MLLNGMIAVRLTAVDQSGQTTSTTVDVVITRKLKVGNFTLSFLDMNIPVAGIPIQIMRTYDSRDKTVGDFGVGWSLSVKSFRVDVNGTLGANWIGTTTGGLLPTYCVQPGQPHIVSVRLQNGAVYQFQALPTPDTQCGLVLPPAMVDLTFVPIGSTPPSYQLSQPNSGALLVSGAFPGLLQLVDSSSFEGYGLGGDTDQWILTMPNGQTVQVSATFGAQAIIDRNGNTLTIGPNGITSSNGPGITFTRDSLNRITGIRDPNLNLRQYQYSSGDLTFVVDQRNNVSKFSYDTNHDLITFTDPSGAQPIRNVYDDSGRLIQQIDALGHVQDFTHDLVGHTETFTDFLGNTTTYTYDDHGNIIRETDPLGNITSKTFDANDNPLTVTNALGKTTSYTYDANNNRLSMTDPLGNTTQSTYNQFGQVLSTTDPNGNATRFTYDSRGNLLTRTDPLGNTTTITFAPNGLPATTTDPLKNITSYGYDAKGNLLTVTDPLGVVTTYAYDANGNRTSQALVRTTSTGPQTLTTRYQYDAQNRLTKTIFPDGSTTQATFSVIGQQSTTVDELGRQTSYSYDADRHLVGTTYADGTSETTTYDAVGNKTSFTNRSGSTTTYTYDPLHRILATTDQLAAAVRSAYDAAGQVISRADALGNTTRFGYDDAGRQTTVTDATGGVTQLTFDKGGSLISEKDPAGNVTTFGRDAAGRATRVTRPDGSIDTMTIDARGSIAALTDAAGKTTQFAYDGSQRLKSVTDALGHTTEYTYDELGNRVSISDPNSHVTRFQYDQRGRRIKRTLPGGQSETFAYDAAGELISHTDFNGKTTASTYDSMGRILSKDPDPRFNSLPVSYSYTALGKRASMIDAAGTTTYNYDALGRLISKQSPAGAITYGYDASGNEISMQSDSLSITYAYDARNRLASVTEPASGTTSYTYDSIGNVQSATYPNGMTHAYAYDSLNRLTTLSVNRSGLPAASYSYKLDPTGHQLSVAELVGRSVSYTYDAAYRLTGESVAGAVGGPDGSVGYAYDAFGNRTQTTSTLAGVSPGSFTYDVDDRLTDDTYDADGNTVSFGGISNVYDFENRLIQRGSASIVYDGDGNRVSETAGGITTKYLVDDQSLTGIPQVIAETGSDGSARTFVYGLQRISQQQFIPGSNSSTTSFYLYDGHGSVRGLASASGAITDTYDYDGFGNLIYRTGTTVNNYLFAGEAFDPALGIYYNRARYYDVRRGRFWTMDALEGKAGDPLSLHKYLYARTDPVNRRDPSGNQDDLIEEAATVDIAAELSSVAVADTIPAFAAAQTVPALAAADTALIATAETAAGGVADLTALGGSSIGAGTVLTLGAEGQAFGLAVELENLFAVYDVEVYTGSLYLEMFGAGAGPGWVAELLGALGL
ncbi:MAG: DUF6531 domain-containing protein [Acidobacteriia bacterium]|nr:DUF6531 domain-containing protein [Terriglobia bacterium]